MGLLSLTCHFVLAGANLGPLLEMCIAINPRWALCGVAWLGGVPMSVTALLTCSPFLQHHPHGLPGHRCDLQLLLPERPLRQASQLPVPGG